MCNTLLLFNCNGGCMNVIWCYVIRSLCLLFGIVWVCWWDLMWCNYSTLAFLIDFFGILGKATISAVAQWLRCCATNRKVAVSIAAGVTGFFIDIKSFRSYYGPVVDSAFNKNKCQVYFLGVKGGRCVRLTTYHQPVPLSRNLGALTSWKLLGLSRPVMGLLYLYTWLLMSIFSYKYSAY